MRTVAAVVALVACVHAGLWAVSRDSVTAPDFNGQLASVSYAPFDGDVNPDEGGQANAEQIRADLKMLAPLTRAVRTYSSTGGVELVPGIASRIRPARHGRRLDRQEQGAQRARNALGRSTCSQASQQRQRHRRRQRNHLPRRAEGRRTDHDDPARQARRSRFRSPPAKSGTSGSSIPSWCRRSTYIAAHILPYWEGILRSRSAVDQAILHL